MSEAQKKYVVLISPTEKLSFMVDDTRFYYRRLPPSVHCVLVDEHTVRGVFDTNAALRFQVAVAKYCIRGWENLIDAEGKPIPFLEEIIEHLPREILKQIGDLAEEASPEEVMQRFFASSTSVGLSVGPADNP